MNVRRLGLMLAAAALGLAACAGTPEGQPSSAPKTRTIEHAMGSTEVPVNPRRVVVLDTDKLDTALTLGVVPVGAARADQVTGWPRYLGPKVKPVEEVGVLTELNLEAIAALQPDLILGSKFRQEKYYSKLSAIAPTVFTANIGTPWKENFLLDGKALGKEGQARSLLTEYEDRAEAVGRKLGDPSASEVSVVRFMPDQIRMYGPESFVGIVLADVGVGRPAAQRLTGAADRRFVAISPERLTEAGGDIIFVTAYGADAATAQEKTTNGRLWQTLPAVKAGRAHTVPDETWMTGIGVTAANRVLDDLEKYLPGAKPST
ncbi:ABC transporter substrate-binding protein [Actinopolymorpha alba]|uniref:ABC transporter substrate-binding protein n=1 Tax=Actinopolymorpha alba TaxID=533267 RepID=UPI00035EFBF6|nr:iron-siderophore ABC transporter substrate-binding protein [Actinopolymorpha alba]